MAPSLLKKTFVFPELQQNAGSEGTNGASVPPQTQMVSPNRSVMQRIHTIGSEDEDQLTLHLLFTTSFHLLPTPSAVTCEFSVLPANEVGAREAPSLSVTSERDLNRYRRPSFKIQPATVASLGPHRLGMRWGFAGVCEGGGRICQHQSQASSANTTKQLCGDGTPLETAPCREFT